MTEAILGRMSKIFTHLAGGLNISVNISAGFLPRPGARVAAVPLRDTLEDKLSPNTTSTKHTFMPIRSVGPNLCHFRFLSDLI